MRRIVFVLLLLLLAVPVPASGAPMHTDFATIRKDAVTIVIGTVRVAPTGDITIDVEKAIRGTAPTGLMKVNKSPDGHLSFSDERVVAFLTGANELRWVGRKVAGGTIETGVLQLSGFFDFNAHLVSPGMMTLVQLGSMLSTGTLTQTLGVTLAFPDGKGGRKTSSKKFTIAYDPLTRKASAPGFSAACLDLNSVYGLEWGQLEVSFADTCPRKGNSSRSLRLEGKPTGADAAGNMQFELVPSGPVMTEAEYDGFLMDASLLDVVRVVKLALADGSVWSWQIGKGLADPSGKLRQPGGMSSSYEQTGGVSKTTETWEFGDAKIVLGAATYGGGNDFSLLSAIDAGTFTKCTLVRKGLAPIACTAKQGAPIFVR